MHAAAERREDADAPVAELVARALDDDGAVVGHGARWRPPGRRGTGAGSRRRADRDRDRRTRRSTAAAGGSPRSSRISRPIARPSSSGRAGPSPFQNGILPGLARRGRDEHAVVRDLLDAPARRAEHERLADARLEHHLLVELADARRCPLGAGEEHAVEPAVGNRARVGDGDALRALARGEQSRDAVPGRRAAAARRTRPTDSGPTACRARPRRCARLSSANGAARRTACEQLVDRPRLHRHHGDDLLGEHVERVARDSASPRRAPSCIARGDRGAREQVAAELREDDAFADGADLVAGAADALQAARDRGGASICTTRSMAPMSMPSSSEEVATSARSCAGLERVLDLDALLARERAVVRAHERLARQLVERAGEPLGQAAAVDEDQRRAVRADQLEQARVDRGPDRGAHRALRRRAAGDVGPGVPIVAMSSTGTSTAASSAFGCRASTIVTGRYATGACSARELVVQRFATSPASPAAASWCARVRAAGASLGLPRRAAEEPRDFVERALRGREPDALQRRRPVSASSRSSESARCAPRLVGTSAWISSMMTVSTERSARAPSM